MKSTEAKPRKIRLGFALPTLTRLAAFTLTWFVYASFDSPALAGPRQADLTISVRDAVTGVPVSNALGVLFERHIVRGPDGLSMLLPVDETEPRSLGATNEQGVISARVSVATTSMFAIRVQASEYVERTDFMVAIPDGGSREVTLELVPKDISDSDWELIIRKNERAKEEMRQADLLLDTISGTSSSPAPTQDQATIGSQEPPTVTVPDQVFVQNLVSTYNPSNCSVPAGYTGTVYTGMINFDEYIAGVVQGEMAGFPPEAQKAQAVAARSYSLNRVNQGLPANCGQSYNSAPACTSFDAAYSTTKTVILYNGSVINGLYSARCNGDFTLNSENGLFSGNCTQGGQVVTYLRRRACSGHSNCSAFPSETPCLNCVVNGQTVRIYGHGVGLCQRGAQGFANGGSSWSQILNNFYTSITIQSGGGTGYFPAPTLTLPSNGSTGQSTTPTFSWSAIAGATSSGGAGYRIMVATNPADLPTDPTASTGGPSIVINATPVPNSYTPSVPLNPGTTYYWEVHARPACQFADWSTIFHFTTAGGTTRTLTVASTNPSSGVSITVSPTDNNGQGNGATQFTRVYNNNQSVSLTAPTTASGNNFQKWQRDGGDWSTSTSTAVTMDASHTMTAVYGTTPPPSNDQCVGAIALSANVIRTDDTANATSTGDPTPTCQTSFGKGVWYTFTPATSGTLTVSSCGSNFDTVLQVYTGSCAALTPVAGGCDDDDGPDCPGTPASVSFSGAAGTTYRILAGGWNSGSGNLQIVARVTQGGIPARPDFNGDGKADILWQNNSTGQHTIWLMNGTTYMGSADVISTPLAWQIASTGDFNNDGKVDIVWQNTQTGACTIQLLNGTTTIGWADFATAPTPVQWYIVGTGDFNSDTKVDILWQNMQTGQCTIELMNGTTTTGWADLGGVPVPVRWKIVGTGDFNGNNQVDILWQNTQTGQRTIQLMNGTATAGWADLFTVSDLSWQIAGASDFNGDGKVDILWQRMQAGQGQRTIELMNGTTTMGWADLPQVQTVWEMRNH